MSDIIKKILKLIDDRISEEKTNLSSMIPKSKGHVIMSFAIFELTNIKSDIEKLIKKDNILNMVSDE